MAAPIAMLLKLQSVDEELATLEREKAREAALVTQTRTELEAARGAAKKTRDELVDVQRRSDEKEASMNEAEDKVKKLKLQRNTVRKNEEYAALTQEIQAYESEVKRLEEEALELMEQVDACRSRLKGLRDDVATREQELARVEAESAQRGKEIAGLIAQKNSTRGEVAAGVDPEAQAAYDRVLHGRGWPALVPARDGSCGGCLMSITGQTMNLLLLGKDLVFCQSCSRILYVEEAEADRVLKRKEAG